MARRFAMAALLALGSCGRSGPTPPAGLPGAEPFAPELRARLDAARAARGAYEPRTRHRHGDGSPRYTNRLILESSPYLQQHAHNPVNWYPWGDEAFAEARRLGRPVLLSVGYATCHWCHVMEEESFEDEEIARFLNAHYVAIKVDREERPDLDAAYMQAVLAISGRGGWPMTVWLTPDRKPFFGGTYFPPRARPGRGPGFLEVLTEIERAYREQPATITDSSARLVAALERALRPAAADPLLPELGVLRAGAAGWRARFDARAGGTTDVPKFPSALPVRFLLRWHRRTRDPEMLHMAVLSLEKMAAGGLYDQIGGGFHRYATDARWLVPHFEKMLYDNALLALAYVEGWQASGQPRLAAVARDVLTYLDRDLGAPGGGFYGATDADSLTPAGVREEGWYFTWTPDELGAVLGAERARLATGYWGVTAAGNFGGRTILSVPRPATEAAPALGVSPEALAVEIAVIRPLLLTARENRPAPLRDEKVLTAWNGLAISAFARAALALGDDAYADRAARAADFVLRELRRDGRLLRSFAGGRAQGAAFLEDYAFLIAGLLDLFEATGERRWLDEAIALDAVLERHYQDPRGGYFATADDGEAVLVRETPMRDGALPSGNAVAALDLLRLHELTTDERYRVRAERLLAAAGDALERNPLAFADLLLAVDYFLDTPKQVVIVAPTGRADARALLAAAGAVFAPNQVLVVTAEGSPLAELAVVVPLVEDKVAMKGLATAYVCERRTCELPTVDPEVFARQVGKVVPLP